MKRYIRIDENGIVRQIIGSLLKPIDESFVENDDLSVFVGSTLNEDGSFTAPIVEFNLEVEKNKATKIIENKTEMLIEYLKKKYGQSNALGTIEDIKAELDFYKLHKAEYEAIADADKEEYLKNTYPATYSYMKVKNRTFEEQIVVSRYKRQLTHLASAKVEDLKSRILACESEEAFANIRVEVDYINSLETIKDFMQVMGGVDGLS